MAAPKSSTLFHFTKSLDALKGILRGRFYPNYCLEDMSWQFRDHNFFIAFPLVSFCDIPIGRITEHINFYGTYGLGMTRQWGVEKGLNPVLYVSATSPLVESVQKSFEGARKLRDKHGDPAYINSIRHLAAFMKPIKGTMPLKGKPTEKEFYLENEWRYVAQAPGLRPYLRHDEYQNQDTLKTSNAAAQALGKLEFSPKDIRYIFVPGDAEIPELVNFIDTELDSHPASVLKLLMTRITSLEHLERDV